jgi:cellulose synthase (UDP-forming)
MPPTPSLTHHLHRPPSGMKFGLAAIAVGCGLVMIASLPASRDLQIAGSICLLTFMLILSLFWRDRQQLASANVVRVVLILGSTLLFLRYLIWRGSESLPLESGLTSAVCGLTLFIAECYVFLIGTLGQLPHLKNIKRTSPPLPADTSLLPNVDVYITTYDEDPELLKTTVIAATQMRYPAQKLNVYVLDDGGTQEKLHQSDTARSEAAAGRAQHIKDIASQFGVHYLARQKNIHSKAGNLNDALPLTQGNFIVVLDCDHVPTADFIERTMGFFLEDEKLFLVQAAHNFVTPDPLERNLLTNAQTPAENEKFYYATMPGLDYLGAAFFCGSAAMLRRSALDDIGGFSTATVTEDAETSLEAFSHGYTSVYLDAPLVSGLQPDTFSGFIQQRARWAQGMWQIFFLKNPWRLKGLSFIQRLMYTNFALLWGFPISRLCLMFMPVIALLWGVTLAEASVPDVLSFCLPALIGSLITGQYLHGRLRWPFISHLYEVIQSLHLARSELKLLGNFRATKFLVTPKAEVLEQDFVSSMAKPFYWMIFLSIAALSAGALRIINEPSQRDMLLFVSFWTLTDFIFLLCALGVTLERKQRRTEPRPRVESNARLEIGPEHTQDGALTDASASGAAIVTNSHSAIWVALIHKHPVKLVIDGEHSFDARVQKITQLQDGRIAVGLSYQLNDTASERSAIAIAFGSSAQLDRNVRRGQYRKNALTMGMMLLHKALMLGFRHFVLLLKPKRQSLPIESSKPRLIWERKNENTPGTVVKNSKAVAGDRAPSATTRER